MENKFNYIKNLDTRGMTMQEKETLESLLKDRNYTDMVRGTSLKDTIELAKQGVYLYQM